MNGSKIKNRVGTAIIIGIFGSMVLSLYCTIQQQAYAVAAAEIQEKYLTRTMLYKVGILPVQYEIFLPY